MGETENYDSKSHNSRYNQTNQKAWLIWDCIDGSPIYGGTFICLDETDALETYMSFIEEEMYETFYTMTQDRFEQVDEDWEERAQWINIWETMWYVMEVPAIYGNTCC